VGSPEIYTNCHITVTIPGISGGMNKLLFNSFTPPSWSTDAPKHKFYGENATTEVLHGGAQVENWGPAQLGRGVDKEHLLFQWVQEIRKKGPNAAKKDIEIKIEDMDESGSATGIAVWNGKGVIITNFSPGASNAATNEIMTESVTLEAEKWEMMDGEGSPIGEGPIE